MPRISTDNYDTVASWNGSQDLFIVEQPDGTKVATPAMVKQFIEAGDFEATGEVKDGHGNILADMAKADDVKGIAEAGDFEATGEVKDGHGNILNDVVTALGNKISITEYRATGSGNNVKLQTPLAADNLYLIAMRGPISASGRRLRLSLVTLANNTTSLNEVYIGDSNFTLTVESDRCVTITSAGLNYGVGASLIKLQ